MAIDFPRYFSCEMFLENNAKDFFSLYSLSMNNALVDKVINPDPIVASFADYFVGASPSGVRGGSNDAVFRKSIENGILFYRRIGVRSMNIVSCEVSLLDDYHAMAKVGWQCAYESNSNSSEILFTVSYLLQKLNDMVKVFAYVTGDEQEAFRDAGLI